jgi:hypothetical protein
MAAMKEYTFLFFGVADIFVVLFTIFVLKETRGLSLEEVQAIYSSDGALNKRASLGSEAERSSTDKVDDHRLQDA